MRHKQASKHVDNPNALWPSEDMRNKFSADWCQELNHLEIGTYSGKRKIHQSPVSAKRPQLDFSLSEDSNCSLIAQNFSGQFTNQFSDSTAIPPSGVITEPCQGNPETSIKEVTLNPG